LKYGLYFNDLGYSRRQNGSLSNWIMDLLSKDNAKLKNENDQVKEMIAKFKAEEYSKKSCSRNFSS
jgi:hypothetical protein